MSNYNCCKRWTKMQHSATQSKMLHFSLLVVKMRLKKEFLRSGRKFAFKRTTASSESNVIRLPSTFAVTWKRITDTDGILSFRIPCIKWISIYHSKRYLSLMRYYVVNSCNHLKKEIRKTAGHCVIAADL